MRIRSQCCKGYMDRLDQQGFNATLCCQVCGKPCAAEDVPEDVVAAGDEIEDDIGQYTAMSGVSGGGRLALSIGECYSQSLPFLPPTHRKVARD